MVLLEYIKDGVQLICGNGYKRYCYLVLTDFMIDYKKHIFITGIIANI